MVVPQNRFLENKGLHRVKSLTIWHIVKSGHNRQDGDMTVNYSDIVGDDNGSDQSCK